MVAVTFEKIIDLIDMMLPLQCSADLIRSILNYQPATAEEFRTLFEPVNLSKLTLLCLTAVTFNTRAR